MVMVKTAQTGPRRTGFTRTGKAFGTPRLGSRRITYADALAYAERPAIARRLRDLQWGYHAIGHALGVAGRTVHRWLVEGTRPMVPVLSDADADDDDLDEDHDDDEDRKPRSAWWPDDDDDDELQAATPIPRSRAKRAGVYGWATPAVVARLRSHGHEVDDDGTVTRWAGTGATATHEPATAPREAPVAVIPPAPPVCRPWAPPERPSAPTEHRSGSPTGTVTVELSCGHVERNLPLGGPWAQRGWVACTRCNLAHRSIRRPVR
jgi:hypothetical protein